MQLFNHRQCIVTFMDLKDIKKLMLEDSLGAETIMHNFCQKIYGQSQTDMLRNHKHIYTWNDSALLLAYIDKEYSNLTPIMREADDLKKTIDNEVHECYAISVEGTAFDDPIYYAGHEHSGSLGEQPKFIFLKASSYAFSNCFEIEKKLGFHKKSWYVDEGIVKRININKTAQKEAIDLWGRGSNTVCLYDGYLW